MQVDRTLLHRPLRFPHYLPKGRCTFPDKLVRRTQPESEHQGKAFQKTCICLWAWLITSIQSKMIASIVMLLMVLALRSDIPVACIWAYSILASGNEASVRDVSWMPMVYHAVSMEPTSPIYVVQCSQHPQKDRYSQDDRDCLTWSKLSKLSSGFVHKSAKLKLQIREMRYPRQSMLLVTLGQLLVFFASTQGRS